MGRPITFYFIFFSFTGSYYFKYAKYCFPFLIIRMITKIISHKLRSMSFIMLVAKANTFGHEFLRCFLVEIKKLIWMVSFEMESKTDLSNRKKSSSCASNAPKFFSIWSSMTEALACTIQIFFRTAILREYWTSVVDSHTNTVISHPDACIVFIIFLMIHCYKHHNCCWGSKQVQV